MRIPNTENSYLITGLTPGVTYIVQVYAVIKEIHSDADKIEATTGGWSDLTKKTQLTSLNMCFFWLDQHFYQNEFHCWWGGIGPGAVSVFRRQMWPIRESRSREARYCLQVLFSFCGLNGNSWGQMWAHDEPWKRLMMQKEVLQLKAFDYREEAGSSSTSSTI